MINAQLQQYVENNTNLLIESLLKLYNAIQPCSENAYNSLLLVGTRGLFRADVDRDGSRRVVANRKGHAGHLAESLCSWFSSVEHCRTRYGTNVVRTFVLPILRGMRRLPPAVPRRDLHGRRCRRVAPPFVRHDRLRAPQRHDRVGRPRPPAGKDV